jgi:hypothetical protein
LSLILFKAYKISLFKHNHLNEWNIKGKAASQKAQSAGESDPNSEFELFTDFYFVRFRISSNSIVKICGVALIVIFLLLPEAQTAAKSGENANKDKSTGGSEKGNNSFYGQGHAMYLR